MTLQGKTGGPGGKGSYSAGTGRDVGTEQG